MSDTDFDALKLKLRQSGSIITAEGPRCSLRSRTMYSNADPDYLRMTAINIPAALVVSGANRKLQHQLVGIAGGLSLGPVWARLSVRHREVRLK